MLLAEPWTLNSDATAVEVDGDLPIGTADKSLPLRLVAVRMVDEEEETVGRIES